ncbi:hypothetical protein GCM10025787_02660 [Saccharopolyspora rosea]
MDTSASPDAGCRCGAFSTVDECSPGIAPWWAAASPDAASCGPCASVVVGEVASCPGATAPPDEVATGVAVSRTPLGSWVAAAASGVAACCVVDGSPTSDDVPWWVAGTVCSDCPGDVAESAPDVAGAVCWPCWAAS